MAISNADRQRAFRKRLKLRLAAVKIQRPLPPKPKISVPATKRWITLADQARADLETRHTEMQQYFDERSDAWQEDDRGATFQEKMDRLEGIIEELAHLDD